MFLLKHRLTTANDLQYTKLDILYIYGNKNENVIHRQIQNFRSKLKNSEN